MRLSTKSFVLSTLSLALGLLPTLARAQVIAVDQIPTEFGIVQAQVADGGCVIGTTPATLSLADDFVLAAPLAVDSLTWLGLYDRPAAPVDPEPFVLRIHFNTPANLPGGVIAEVAATVTQTFLLPLNNASIYSFTATFAPVTLRPGTYWIELFEADDSTNECFEWLLGPSDPLRGRPGSARSDLTAPGVTWFSQPAATSGFALRVIGHIPAEEVPTLAGAGLAVMSLLLAVAAVALLARGERRRAG